MTQESIRWLSHVAEQRHDRGLLDTSAVIDLDRISAEQLPAETAISAITMAELAAGPHAARTADDRARRQDRLQRVTQIYDPLPFDDDCARAYGRVYAAVVSAGRKPRGARAGDLLIAATAVANQLPLYTRNPADYQCLQNLLTVVAI